MTHVEGLCIKGCTDIGHQYFRSWDLYCFWAVGSVCLDLTCMLSQNPSCGSRMPMLAPSWRQSMCLWRRTRLSCWHRDPTLVLAFLSLWPVVSMANTASSRLHHQALFLWVSLVFLETPTPFLHSCSLLIYGTSQQTVNSWRAGLGEVQL